MGKEMCNKQVRVVDSSEDVVVERVARAENRVRAAE